MRALNINMDDLREKVASLVVDQAINSSKSGSEKHSIVVAAAVAWLDEKISFKGPLAPLAEAASDAVIKLLVGLIVQQVFDSLRRTGAV